MLVILTLTFTQGHIDLNHDNNQCSLSLETVQAMPITFAVKIVQLNIYIIILFSQFDDLDLHSKSQLRLEQDTCFNVYCNSNTSDNISAMAFKLGMPVDSCSFR